MDIITKKIYRVWLVGFFVGIGLVSFAQNVDTSNNSVPSFTLKQCIDYALQHQPSVQKSLLNISVAKATNAINKSGWLPQASANATFTDYLKLPTTLQSGTGKPIQTGVVNTLIPGVAVSQIIFSPTLKYASSAAPLLLKSAEQTTDSLKIELVSTVSKSFYSLLLTLQEINIVKEDTVRLGQNFRDSYHQYVAGIVDETDYEQATISLNNSTAQLRQANESLYPQYALLKQLIGLAPENQFNVIFDTAQMQKDIEIDTTVALQYDKRIEWKQLANIQSLQHQLTNYYQNAVLPTVSGFFNYNFEFENNQFSKLYDNVYPYSYIGLTASVPLFTGFARVQGLHRSQLQERELGWNVTDLKSRIYSEYANALANYKSNLNNLQVLKKNEDLAKRVYFVVALQYKQGIVAYLNVINAESNLITAENGYLNALYQVLSSKIDLQKARGEVSY